MGAIAKTGVAQLLLSQLPGNPDIVEVVRRGLMDTALMEENWYRG